MKRIFVVLLLMGSLASAENKKCSVENLEFLAKSYKQVLAAMVKSAISQDKAMMKILKDKKSRTDPEVVKEMTISKSFSDSAPLLQKITKIETENPECKF